MDFPKLRSRLNAFVSDYGTPGVDCMIYKDHEVIFRHSAGMSDIENGRKVSGDELYYIYSMTKMLTCTAALQLLERGKYVMSDPVSKYLPEFEKMKISSEEYASDKGAEITTGASLGEGEGARGDGYAKTPITVHHLFSMAAGLDYNLQDEAISTALKEGKTTTRELVSAMANKVLNFEPGTRFSYSLCHDVLGALCEIWSGQMLGDYMQENIFAPLGMKNTFFETSEDDPRREKMAALYKRDKNGKPVRRHLSNHIKLAENFQGGGAGLTSSTEDYALFVDAIACGGVGKTGNRILSSASVDFMRTNQLNEQQYKDFQRVRPGYTYGCGVRIHTDKVASGSISPIGEFGWDGAAGAFSLIDPERRLSLVYFQHILDWDVRIETEMKNALYADIDSLE